MLPLSKARARVILLLGLAFCVILATEVARETPHNGARRSAALRETVARLRATLPAAERHLDTFRELNAAGQVALMQSTVDLFKEALPPHIAAGDAMLLPALDGNLPEGTAPLAAALRREHDILRRRLGELEILANAAIPDPHAFTRRAERLLGQIEAHLEIEEEILYPILDQPSRLSRRTPRPRP